MSLQKPKHQTQISLIKNLAKTKTEEEQLNMMKFWSRLYGFYAFFHCQQFFISNFSSHVVLWRLLNIISWKWGFIKIFFKLSWNEIRVERRNGTRWKRNKIYEDWEKICERKKKVSVSASCFMRKTKRNNEWDDNNESWRNIRCDMRWLKKELWRSLLVMLMICMWICVGDVLVDSFM